MTKMKKQLANLKRALKMLCHISPWIFPQALIAAVMNAAYPYIGIFLSARILTELADPARSMKHLIFLACLLVGLNFLGNLLVNFNGQFLDVLQYVEMKHVEKSVATKAWQMDYDMLGDPEIRGKQERMMHWGYGRGILAIVNQFRSLLQALCTIGISAALVAEFFSARAAGDGKIAGFVNHWMFPVLFLGLFALTVVYSLWTEVQVQKRSYQMDKDAQIPLNHMFGLLESSCSDYPNGKEVRMFHLQELLSNQLKAVLGQLTDMQKQIYRYGRKMNVSWTFLSQIFQMLVYLFVGLKAIGKAFGVGNILKYTGMVTQLNGGVRMLCDTIRDIYQNSRYLDDYFAYLDTPNRTADGTLPVTQEIADAYEFEFRNVTFTYPQASSPSLKNVSCRFKKGEKIAVVGRNGSGKTTFIKLLCRLYDPQEGQILLNGVDIRRYQYEEYLRFFSTVFQDYQIFAFELGENVAAESEYEESLAAAALENAGFGERLQSLEKGLRTPLFKFISDDGIELSGGESQKVAIARCLYKDAPYAILDEPTAALDAVAEADIYQRMNQFIRDKGAIYISHRLSSCHFCNRIFVFDDGSIVEQGTHATLLAAHGLYRKLWDAQAKYYQS